MLQLCSLAATNISSVLKVRLGEYDVSVTTEQLPYEELDVSHVMVHPQFNNLSLANDIALVRFVKPARRRPHIDVACMPHPGQIAETEGTRCVVTGWGRKFEGSFIVHSFFRFVRWGKKAYSLPSYLTFESNRIKI
jgi:Trypsin